MAQRGADRGFRGRGGPPRGSPDLRGRGGPPTRGGFGQRGGIFATERPAIVDARLTDDSQDSLVRTFQSLKLKPDDLPSRPDFGSKGQVIKLRANYFPVKVPKGPLYEYNVVISPVTGTSVRRVRRRIFQLAEQSTDWTQLGLKGLVAHDHSAKLIAAKPLAQPLVITTPFYEEDEDGPRTGGKEYKLSIEYIQDIDTQNLTQYLTGHRQYRDYDIMPVVSALNVILAGHPNRSGGGGVMVGRNRFFFPTASQPFNLSGGLEAWKGFYSSVRPTHNQLMVNVNVCTTAFYTPGNLATAMTEFRNSSFGARPSVFVKGVRIIATHLGYRKTVKSLANVNAKQHSFDTPDYGRVTVEAYFKKKYNITLQYPEIPLVDVGGQKQNFLPTEVCEILPNQPFRGKLTDEHTANMIKFAANYPNENAKSIVGPGLNELGFRRSESPLGAFGVKIGEEMTVIPGRILPPPGIKYGQGSPRVDERASWNLRNVKFARGGRLENWAVLVVADGNRDDFKGPQDPELKTVVKGFADMCKTSGMTVENKDPPIIGAMIPQKNPADPTRAAAIEMIRKQLLTLKTKPNLVLVILSNGDKHVYAGIKHLCDSHLDIATLCVHSSKIRKDKGQVQYFANVALKANIKTGGVNHALESSYVKWLQQTPTMLVGIDVTHPGPGSIKGTPSIAAVVASVDDMFAQYPCSMEMQESKKEMVTNLDRMMVERLKLYKAKNKMLPQRIVVYRDGVSDGQFPIVVDQEMPLIKAAAKKFDTLQAPYRPKLTIVICGKRHNTRFFPTDAAHADQNGSPRPGTVVDRGVTSIYNFDFFLQAHGGLQGSTKPTHYFVVHDEIGFSADDLQGLTNAVSYMFARATKAVSLVSPAYYADLACERGRCYLHKILQGVSGRTGQSGSGSEGVAMKEAQILWHNGVSGPKLKDTMFYL